MNTSRTLGKIGAGIAAVSLGLLGIGLTATPASAEPESYNITTSSVEWQYIQDAFGGVGDASPFDSETGIRGWRSDAFDSMPSQFRVTEGGESSWTFVADTVERDINEGGKSTLVLTGNTGDAFATTHTVTLTLTFEGNYARWAYVVSGGDTSNVDVFFEANLGSDDNSQFVESGNTLVSNDGRPIGEDGGSWTDPVIGYTVDTDGEFTGYDVEDGQDGLRPGALGATTFTLTVVLADYEPTAGDKATAFVTSLAPTLDASFGEAYSTVRSSLFTLDAITLTKGVAVNTTLSGVVGQKLIDDEEYLGDEAGQIGAIFQNVPAGLTMTFGQDKKLLPVITVTGTPTESGDFVPTVTLYQVGGGGEERIAPSDAIGSNPVSATAAITVPAVVAPSAVVPDVAAPQSAAKPVLAATGFDGMILIGFGGLAAAAGMLLVAATRRRRA